MLSGTIPSTVGTMTKLQFMLVWWSEGRRRRKLLGRKKTARNEQLIYKKVERAVVG